MFNQIVWPEEWSEEHINDDNLPVFLYSVDGVHCRTNEPIHHTKAQDRKAFSHKFKQAGVAYELAVSIFTNALVWMNGPFRSSKHDITIFRKDGLMEKTPTGRKGIGDNGYRGERGVLSTPNSHDAAALRKFKVSFLVFLLDETECFAKATLSTTYRVMLEQGRKPSMPASKNVCVLMINFGTA